MENTSGPQANQVVVRPTPNNGTLEERGVFTDVVVPIGLGVAGSAAYDALKTGAGAAWDKVTGGDAPTGKHSSEG